MSGFKADNAAYDLSLFDPSKKLEKKQRVLTVATNIKSVKARRFAVSNIMLAVIFAVLCALYIGSYSKLNELTSDIDSSKKQYSELAAEGERLSVELERKIDLKQIEEIAVNEYYMQKLEKDQIEYINLTGEDKAEIVEDSSIKSFFSNLFANITGILG